MKPHVTLFAFLPPVLSRLGFFAAICCLALVALATPTAAIEALSIDGTQFKTAAGEPVRFWGVNLVSSYPTHAQADAIAANLASREINLARPHHNLRSSLDWNPISGIPALVTYGNNTRTPHAEAWDRFDYLNAQLRARGIYIVLSLHSSRRFLAGDVDIMTTDATDRTAWMNAMTALNASANNLDRFKMLPMIDERAARLMEEFTQQLLTHVNPYTGIAYGEDPQVIYLEAMNETSTEYAVISGNRFSGDTAYWGTVLQAKWDAYTAANGITPCDLYAAGIGAQRQARSDFIHGLDQAYFNRIKTLVRSLGCQAPMAFSNLWRGDRFQKLEESLSDVIEEHDYDDPLVVREPNDLFSYFARSTPVGKPYIIGELNEGQTDALINANAPYRTMLQLASAVYGNFNDWSGAIWFAWSHGDKMIGRDGWSIWEERRPAVNSDIIGNLQSDGMILDHLRTTGILFKRGLVAPSTGPLTWFADDPLGGNLNYQDMMAPKYPYKAGWQNIHAMKRAFGPVPPAQATAPWMTTAPVNPLVSDTNQIRKDVVRQQLTVSAPQAEAFSGKLDATVPAGLTHLGLGATSGFATVILVADDGQPLTTSESLVISRTYLDGANNEIESPVTTLSQLKAPAGGDVWHLKRTRPRGETGYEPLVVSNGTLVLPADGWHEAELKYAPAGSLPPRQIVALTGDLLRPVFDDAYRIAGVFSTAQGGFTLNAQAAIDPSTAFTPAEGVKSVRMKFTAGLDPVVLGFNFTNSGSQARTLDFTSWRTSAGLRFWIFTKRTVPSLAIELACDNAGQTVEVRLPLANYLQSADYGNKWVEVTVPFADFPDTGLRYDAATGQNTPAAFLWDRVKGVGFYCSTVTSGYYDPYFDDLRIIRIAAPGSGPAAPTGLVATAGNAQVELSWTALPGALGYFIKRSTTDGGPYAIIGSQTTTSHTDTTATNGVTYYYVVSATDATGEGVNSAQATAMPSGPPPAPTGLAVVAGDGEVNLNWSASPGATSYNVKRATTSGGPYVVVGSATSTSFPDITVSNGTTYYYAVSAVNASGEGANSTPPVSAAPIGSTGTTTATFVSLGTDDGWVQESSQTSGVGGGFGSTNATGQALIIGDTNSNRQNKLIVSFDTTAIPGGATIISATLKLRRGALIGGNPFASLGSCYVDLKAGAGFGESTALVAADFQAPADVAQVAVMSNPVNNGDWSTGSLNAAGLDALDRNGCTQLRVYFASGDNNNSSNDYVGFYSGENAAPENRPILEVVYETASGEGVPTITTTDSATGTYGSPFSHTITATSAPVVYRATGLPPGLTLHETTGVISGVPTAAGDFPISVSATNARGTADASLNVTVAKAVATVMLEDLKQTYDGTGRPVTAHTIPAGLALQLTYDGIATPPTNAGSYHVAATVESTNYAGAAADTLVVAKAIADVRASNLVQSYDGTPKSVATTTNPAGLPVELTFASDSATSPTTPGVYAFVASVRDANYTGFAAGDLTITITALVQHAPVLNGSVDGSVQVLSGENLTLNGTAWISGDLLLPGTPTIGFNGSPIYGGQRQGEGSATPVGYAVTLNGNALVRHLVSRTDPIALPVVDIPLPPSGTRHVTVNQVGQACGDFATLRNLTLNGNAGMVAVPPGRYGAFAANAASGFVLGVAGAEEPAVYEFESLLLNANSSLQVIGPVVVTLAGGATFNGNLGEASHPEWLTLRFAAGGATLNGGAVLHGSVVAPVGSVLINGNSEIHGQVASARLTINGQGLLENPEP